LIFVCFDQTVRYKKSGTENIIYQGHKHKIFEKFTQMLCCEKINGKKMHLSGRGTGVARIGLKSIREARPFSPKKEID
jgi:hypothetical protein